MQEWAAHADSEEEGNSSSGDSAAPTTAPVENGNKKSQTQAFLDSDTDEDEHDGPSAPPAPPTPAVQKPLAAKKSQTQAFLDSDTDEDEHDGPSEGKPPMQKKASFAPKYDHTGFVPGTEPSVVPTKKKSEAQMFLDSDTDEEQEQQTFKKPESNYDFMNKAMPKPASPLDQMGSFLDSDEEESDDGAKAAPPMKKKASFAPKYDHTGFVPGTEPSAAPTRKKSQTQSFLDSDSEEEEGAPAATAPKAKFGPKHDHTGYVPGTDPSLPSPPPTVPSAAQGAKPKAKFGPKHDVIANELASMEPPPAPPATGAHSKDEGMEHLEDHLEDLDLDSAHSVSWRGLGSGTSYKL